MDITLFLPLLFSWIEKKFPSLSDYVEYAGPIFMIVATALGVFTNLLPTPGHKYPVPDVSDLETQLQGSAGFILKMAKSTRALVISVNWFLGTAVYDWFYRATNAVSNFLPKLNFISKLKVKKKESPVAK